jgi:hypothetical protein
VSPCTLPRHAAFLLLLVGLLSSGCYGRARGYAVAEGPPVYIETYPSYYYEGHTVYWVDGRWYTRDRGRWVYYRSEPRELYRYRTHVRSAPPAPGRHFERRGYRREAAPPGRSHWRHGPRRAPPARRMR